MWLGCLIAMVFVTFPVRYCNFPPYMLYLQSQSASRSSPAKIGQQPYHFDHFRRRVAPDGISFTAKFYVVLGVYF